MRRLILTVLSSCILISGAQATNLPSCSLEGFDWQGDPVLAESRHPATRHHRISGLICRTTEVYEPMAGEVRLRVLRAKVYQAGSGGDGSPGVQESVNLFTVSRVTPQGEVPVGRFLARYDISRDRPFIDPAVGVVDGEPILTLGRNVATAYRITTGGIVPFDAHAWVGKAAGTLERNFVAGQVRLVDFTRMAGYLAVFPADSDDPARPGSERTDLALVKAHLAFENGQLVVKSVERVHRNEIQDVEESAAIADIEESFASARRRLPRGTEPCYLNAWSIDTDPAGLNVRAGPSERSRVLGRVPPAWTAPGRDGDPGTTYRSEFEIAGYRAGWFLIRKIKAPGEDYNERYPRSRPQPFRGQGWVSARHVGGALSNGGLPTGRLMQAPNAHAAFRDVARNGEPISTGDIVQRLYACSGNWALIEMEGVRGWWNTICSNQVTNCS
jgi:hypothetical protein